ncbi:autotransporter domain-containing protein [Azorhizobium caulinodans]|uniref:autotransporter domain-containing protein n=2 Tax=Azorhizobium caulinodans TaxID=7 RepID=UPI002FBD4008
MLIGISNTGNLAVEGGLTSDTVSLGYNAGSAGTLTVSGGTWTNSGDLYIGNSGSGTVALSSGASASSGNTYLGSSPGGSGTLTVSDGSSFTSSGSLYVGYAGNGGVPSAVGGAGTLTVTSGTVTTAAATLADGVGATGEASLTGSASTWSNTGALAVGGAGVGSLSLSAGASLNTGSLAIGSLLSTGTSTVTVTGTDTGLTSTGSLIVGNFGAATLTVQAGGSVTSNGSVIGRHSASSSTVNGTGSTWTTGNLQIGGDASDASGTLGTGTLTISSGGKVVSTAAQVGAVSGAQGTVTVEGAGSSWQVNSGALSVGFNGTGTLTVRDGASVSSGDATIGSNVSSGGTVTVTGTGSTWSSTGNIYVGNGGTGTLTIENGGVVSAVGGYVSTLTGSTSSLTVTGANSALNLSGTFIAGYSSGTSATVTLSNGGQISGLQGTLGDLAGSSGTMAISGSGSKWSAVVDSSVTYSGYMNVGRVGTGSLSITDGGNVTGYRLYIGNEAGSVGTVTLSGSGSLIQMTSNLYVGSEGTGTLTLSDGAQISAAAIKVGYLAGSVGTLNIGAAAGQTAAAAGTIDASEIVLGAGDSRLVLNHTSADYGLAANITGSGQVIVLSGTTVLTGENTYTGTTTITAGTLQIGNGGTSGSIAGDVANNGTLAFNRSDAVAYAGAISGTGSLTQAGTGTLTLTAANAYTGGTTISAGTLQIGNGGTTGSIAGNVSNVGRLVFNRSDALTYGGVISGSGSLTQAGPGTLTLTETNTYTGGTSVQAGGLAVNGSIAGNVTLATGTTLSGSGSIAGNVSVNGGTLSGTQAAPLTMGSLTLASASNVNVTLGAPSANPAFNVLGNLTLDGTLNVTADTGFGMGVYRLFNYGGALTDNGLDVASVSGLAATVQTAVAGQVNLLVTDPGQTILFWNGTTITPTGTIVGGNGTWSASPQTNWTNASGTLPQAWNGGFAVFQGAAGTITVDAGAGAVSTTGMQFVTSGYLVTGDALTLSGTSQATVRVGDGTAGGAGTVATIASVLTGTGGINKTDLGTLILTGANTYTGGTTITAGTLQIGNGGTSGSITGDVSNNGTLVFNRSDAVTYSGAVSGTGALTKAGAGTLILTGTNTYTGTTTIASGTLQIGNGGTTGSILGDIANSAVLAFNRSDALTYAGVISGTGSLTQAGTGTLTLTGTNSYTGGTTISAGTLQIGNGGTSGSITGNVLDNGTLTFNRSDAVTFAGAISGTGSLTKAGSGILTLTGANSYTGGTTVSGGTLVGNTTSLTGNIVDNASVVFNQTTTGTYSGVISGTGALTKTGSGTLILTGNSTYTGGTLISEGTLQIGNGGATGSIIGNVINNATLVFNRSGTYDFPGTITGSGAVIITGGSTVNFTSANGYNGAISVSDSSFVLTPNAVSSSSYTVGTGGTISGTGTIGGLTVASGGTAAPGYSPGTLTVAGNVTFLPGSVYSVDVTPSGAHDLITASGTASILGGTVAVNATAGGYSPVTTLTILQASGGVSGTFASVTSNLAFLTPLLGYDANDVYLTLRRNDISFASQALTANQRAVAGAADGLGWSNPVYYALANLPVGAAPAAFDSLSGEAYASSSTVMLQQSIYLRDAVGARLGQALAPATAPGGPETAALAPGLTPTLWMQGFGAWGNAWGNGNAASVSSDIAGVFGGADVALGDHWRVGLMGGYSRTTLDANARNSSGTIDNYDIGLYAGARYGDLGLKAGVSYTWHDAAMTRSAVFSGYSGRNTSGYDAGTTQVFGEAGYTFRMNGVALEPFAGLAYVHLSTNGLTETGSTSALSVSTGDMDTLFSSLGVRVGSSLTLVPGLTVSPSLSLAWLHAFGDVAPAATTAFATGSQPFTVTGVPLARDSALIGAGLDYRLNANAVLSATYSGQFASGIQDNAFKGMLTVNF